MVHLPLNLEQVLLPLHQICLHNLLHVLLHLFLRPNDRRLRGVKFSLRTEKS